MTTNTPELSVLRATITERLNTHDLEGVMDYGAPADEYGPEAEDFAALMAAGEPITPGVVTAIWHKWFGDPSEEPAGPTPAVTALAADLQAIQHSLPATAVEP